MGRGAGRVGIGGKMKKLRLLTVIALIACYLLSAVACAGGGAVLETPTGLWVEPADLILNWDGSKTQVNIKLISTANKKIREEPLIRSLR